MWFYAQKLPCANRKKFGKFGKFLDRSGIIYYNRGNKPTDSHGAPLRKKDEGSPPVFRVLSPLAVRRMRTCTRNRESGASPLGDRQPQHEREKSLSVAMGNLCLRQRIISACNGSVTTAASLPSRCGELPPRLRVARDPLPDSGGSGEILSACLFPCKNEKG